MNFPFISLTLVPKFLIMTRSLILLLTIFLASYNLSSQCGDSAIYKGFRGKWNKKVEIFKESSWQLPEIEFDKAQADTFEIVHSIQRGGINMIISLTKKGCIKRMSLLVNKYENLDVQSLVAMTYLAEFFNFELSSAERQKTIEGLKKEAEEKKLTVSKQVSKNTYVFEPGMIVNVLTIFIGS